MDLKWYLVKTKPLNETRIHNRLTEAGFESIYPKILKKIRGKGRIEARPLFPTYLFVRFALEQLRTIRYTRGVAKIVSFGPEPQEPRGVLLEDERPYVLADADRLEVRQPAVGGEIGVVRPEEHLVGKEGEPLTDDSRRDGR